MPRFDGTGPRGFGPGTGWGRGYCNPAGSAYGPNSGWIPGHRSGFGRGRRAGRGRGFGRDVAMNPSNEIGALRQEADFMKDELDAVNRRIEELEKESRE